jgi:hypothetical protein
MKRALDSLGRLSTNFFVACKGANVPRSMWTPDQIYAFDHTLKYKGFKECDVVPLNFCVTSTGTLETTWRNTTNNLMY